MNQLTLNNGLGLNVNLSLNQQLSLSLLKMNFVELNAFLIKEFESNPALDGELPSLSVLPDYALETHTPKGSLKEELLFQLHSMKPSQNLRICEYLIDLIDERGYLTQDILEMSKQLNMPYSLIEKSIRIIQDFEPIGVGAYDLKECLLIQLKKLYPNDLTTKLLVLNHLSDLLYKRFDILIEKTSFTLSEIKRSLHCVSSLNPIPGNGWSSDDSPLYIVPDVLLFDEGESFLIELPNKGFNKIVLNPYYIEHLAQSNKQDKTNIRETLNRAQTIIRGLKNREDTLYQITKVITARQRDYLKLGKPLSSLRLIDIAHALGVHESTISRGLSDKYVLYHGQMIKLSNLLSQKSSYGTSVDSIKTRLNLIIQNENKQRPFSDPQLMNELKSYGLDISRRTVTKYRQELGIASAKQRKVECLEDL